ncbi:metabotropic glutamate receptor 2-like, partial [Penaeus japonicus]|uniref:metabotropic glutamate receptor 2-like n=1 Tax=Penaeus japonicus TaxID=27405 RepID=UPI001C70E61A
MLLPGSRCLPPVLPAVLWTASFLLNLTEATSSSPLPPPPPPHPHPHDRQHDLRTLLYDGARERLAPHNPNLAPPPIQNTRHPPHSLEPHVPPQSPPSPPSPQSPQRPAPHPRTKRLAKPSQGGGLNFTWPAKRVVVMDGDVVLGGLMMVHERHNALVCGPIMPQGGVQSLEAMLYTLDFINDQEDFIPGVRLGAHILDDCDKDTYGLEQAVDFIKGSISNIDDGEYKCRDGSSPEVRNKVISGVVGAASSVTSIQVANLLRLFKIPQVRCYSVDL